MSKENKPYPEFSYDEHARNCAPDDFLKQTRRTVQGVPVSDEQIQMIVDAIVNGLDFKSSDVLLEIACGNGALSRFLFGSCKGYLGVDISEHLISVAKKNFEMLPYYMFLMQGAKVFLQQEEQPEKYTKLLCYAGFQYFSDDDAVDILSMIYRKFCNVQTVFIGSTPDKDNAEDFYTSGRPTMQEMSDPTTAIGVWRAKDDFKRLARLAGWKVQFSTMPPEFYASNYRYDAVLSR